MAVNQRPLIKMEVAKITFDHQRKILSAAKKLARSTVPMVVDRNKKVHPWKNRTGQAELKLHGGVNNGSKLGLPVKPATEGFYIYMAHGATEKRKNKQIKRYGFYLETMQGGRFAVLKPMVLDVWDLYISNLPLIDVREDYAQQITELY